MGKSHAVTASPFKVTSFSIRKYFSKECHKMRELNSAAAGNEKFSEQELAVVDAVIERHKTRPGSLIPVLEEVQEAIGYLPRSVQRRVALGLPYLSVKCMEWLRSIRFSRWCRGEDIPSGVVLERPVM